MIAGAVAALGSSCTWAFASTRYAQASRSVGSARVNLARAVVVFPIYAAVAVTLGGARSLDGLTPSKLAWLAVSAMCSYGFGDNLFFAASRRIGVTTALAIGSSYPLWATVVGLAVGGATFDLGRAIGCLLCVAGVAALILLAPVAADAAGVARRDLGGVGLGVATSLLWALNTVAVQHGATGLSPWQANAVRYAFALVVLSASVAALGRRDFASAPPGGWRTLLPAILADALLGSLLFVYGLTHADLAVGATLTSLAPLISVPFAIALGEERWSAPRTAAIAVTVAGVVVLVAAS